MEPFETLLFEQSKAWIEENFDATTKDLPDYLLDIWMENQEQIEKHEDTLPVRIFIYAYLGHLALKNGHVSLDELTEDELYTEYYYWQVKLASIDVDRRTHLTIAPLPLFSFDPTEAFIVTEKGTPTFQVTKEMLN